MDEVGKLAITILKEAELDSNSEDGFIRVDPNLLFQFYMIEKMCSSSHN